VRARPGRAVLLACLACLACAHVGPSSPIPDPDRQEWVDPPQAARPATPAAIANATPTATPTPTATATPTSAPTATEATNTRLAAIRAEVDALLTAEASVLWEAWTKGTAPDLDPSLTRHAGLFAPDTLQTVARARERAAGDERRALSLLHAFLVGERLERDASAADKPAPAVMSWDGRAIPVTRAPSLLAAEPDAARRAALERAWLEAEQRRAPRVAVRWEHVAAAASKLGYGSLLALAAELRGETVEGLTALAEDVLAATDAVYRALLEAVAQRELGRHAADLRGRDLPRLFRAGEDPRAFPAARLAGDATGALGRLGLELAGRPGVVIDAEPRAGKDARALALPVEVPGSVRVSFAPAAGAGELRALLHELGAAAFYAHVATPALEFRRLGALTAETWAELFEDLAGHPLWLGERTGLAEAHLAPIVRSAAARRLHEARTYAARILVELARSKNPAGVAAAAKPILERAFARPVDAEELQLFLLDRDPLLEAADALRPMLLAAEVEGFLARRSEGPWWHAKESGAWLAQAFTDGSRLAPGELARAVGATGVGAAALAAASEVRAAAAGVSVTAAAERPPGT
jgi:hypothetical protein